MNPHRPNKNYHITVHDHHAIDLPGKHTFFGYCFEEAAQPHTHILVQFDEPISKAELLRDIMEHNNLAHPPDIKSHRNFGSILGYHTGFGGKEPCQHLVVITPSEWNPEEYRKARLAKRCYSLSEQRMKTDILVREPLPALVREGFLPPERYSNLKKNIEELKADELQATLGTIRPGDPLPTPWDLGLVYPPDDAKRRHFWFWSTEPNTGKTTFARSLESRYKTGRGEHPWQWWHTSEGDQFIILDRYSPTTAMAWTSLEALCDGDYYFNRKCTTMQRHRRPYSVVILSNFSPEACHEGKEKYLYVRFQVINVD